MDDNVEELRNQVKLLTDRSEIRDCMLRYARGIDRQDRALLRSAYRGRFHRLGPTDPSYDRPLAASRTVKQ